MTGYIDIKSIIWAAIIAFGVVMIAMPYAIPALKKLKYGQTINEFGPESHMAKQGVPTMGGVVLAIAIAVSSLICGIATRLHATLAFVIASGLLNGAIGGIDDYIKVSKQRSEGLTPKQKILLQIAVGAVLTVWAYFSPIMGSRIIVPYFNAEWNLSVFYIPIMIFLYVGIINSTNLLDGVDGIEASCSITGFGAFTVLCAVMGLGLTAIPRPLEVPFEYYNDGMQAVAIACAAAGGACLGFLRFNSHPARIIMGDTGSMLMGGLFMGAAMTTRLQILLLPICFAAILSSLTDIIQVLYCRLNKGRRLFKMAPLHHHLELSGMSESRIVAMYTIMSAAMCLLALLAL